MRQFPCPKCGRSLEQAGEVTCAGETLPVYQCDDCISTVLIGGEPFEVAYTFALDDQGKPFDPADVDL